MPNKDGWWHLPGQHGFLEELAQPMSMTHCSSNKADLCNVQTGRHARVPTLRSVAWSSMSSYMEPPKAGAQVGT